MNLAPLTSLSVLVADIVVPPPTPKIVPSHLAGNGYASLGFWALAIMAGATLWWLRQRRSPVAEQSPSEPK